MKNIYSTGKKFFSGLYKYNYVNQLKVTESFNKLDVFRVLDSKGKMIDKKFDTIPKDISLKIFKTMAQTRNYDVRFNMAQREGKISFYMTGTGEEAAVTGSVAALEMEDVIYPQYRESGVYVYRGYTIQDLANQLTGNYLDPGKGRQMPVHYTASKLNIQSVKSPLSTQLPQVAGAGYHFRVQNLNKICVTYFGEGSASEGDFHPALNFAATLGSQSLFFCRNNKYAISTPSDEQYAGDGIAVHGVAYGIASMKVDGNDPIAVYHSVKKAREYILEKKKPFVIEAITYRVGDHSTSDYSKMYRTEEEMKKWGNLLNEIGDPIERYLAYLKDKNWMTDNEYKTMIEEVQVDVRESLKKAMATKKPSIDSMFDDVYETLPNILNEQKQEMREHIAKYKDKYDLEQYDKGF